MTHRNMQKNLALALLTVCLGTASASAQHYYDNELHTGFYLSARGALTIPGDVTLKSSLGNANISLKNGYDVSAAVGYRLRLDEFHSFKFMKTREPWALRFEVEGGYGTNDFDLSGANGDLDTYRMMGNVMLDIPLTDMFYVSLGGGIGWIHSKVSISGMVPVFGAGFLTGSDVSFAYQAGVVLGAQLNDYWNLELSYRAMSYTDINPGGVASFEAPLINMLGIGVSVQF